MTIQAATARACLVSKGFRRTKRKSDHEYYVLFVDESKTRIFVKISHGAKGREIDDYLLGRMKRTLGLDTNDEARDLLECGMTAQDYIRILRASGRI